MPSKSLVSVSSWTASFVPSATRAPRSPHEAHHDEKKISASHPRLPVLKHLHVLWKGMGVSSPRKSQLLASDPMLRPVSPTINRSAGAATLTSRLTPTASRPLDLPSPPSPSPTTPAPASRLLSGGVDTGVLVITASEGEIGSMFSRRAFLLPVPESRSPVFPPAGPELCSSSSGRRKPVPPISTCLSCRLPLSSPSSYGDTSIPPRPRLAASGSGSALDAATRLRDFRALIAEMRAAPVFRYDLKEVGEQGFVDAGNPDNVDNDNDDDDGNDNDERGELERVLRLLEDVMRNVKQLGLRRKDAAGLGHFVNRDRRSSLGRQSSTLPCLSGENVKCSQVTI